MLWVCQLTHSPTSWGPQELSGSSPKRRRAEDKDEGIGSPDIWEDEKAEDLRREMIELRQQLDKERSVRMMLEEQVRQRPLLASVIPRHRGWILFSSSLPSISLPECLLYTWPRNRLCSPVSICIGVKSISQRHFF